MYKHPISREPMPFSVTTVEPDEAGVWTSRLQDIGDFACCAAFALLSLAMTACLWWGVISTPALR
jgi:hypothetical protein